MFWNLILGGGYVKCHRTQHLRLGLFAFCKSYLDKNLKIKRQRAVENIFVMPQKVTHRMII